MSRIGESLPDLLWPSTYPSHSYDRLSHGDIKRFREYQFLQNLRQIVSSKGWIQLQIIETIMLEFRTSRYRPAEETNAALQQLVSIKDQNQDKVIT